MSEAGVQSGWKLDNSYARLPRSLFSVLDPTPVAAPRLAVLNGPLAGRLGLDARALRTEEGIAVLAGNRVPDGATPLAQAYAGHQFGSFTMLGDGRAHLLGEQIAPTGERFDIQLKGSGKTPYSRGGDGRAALGPMLREYLVSEAMHALGIPTTRSLAVVTTGEPVFREAVRPGAVLTRVAASHLRVGTFEYVSRWGTPQELGVLAEYTIRRHFPDLDGGDVPGLLREVVRVQAELVARWQLVGFVHGVMNTDNTALSGETIDYGPCAFMDTYDPATVFSSIDHRGRYAYGNQPAVAAWNLARFAETLLPLLHQDRDQAVKRARHALAGFDPRYREAWLAGMRAKLGIWDGGPDDEALIGEILRLMQTHRADFTNTFRGLTVDRMQGTELFESREFGRWRAAWQRRLEQQRGSRESVQERMKQNNPSIIPRNHRVEEALEAAEKRGDLTVMERFLAVLSRPYAYSGEQEEYAVAPPPASQPYRTFCGT